MEPSHKLAAIVGLLVTLPWLPSGVSPTRAADSQDDQAKPPAVGREELRFDGKPFAHWKDYCRTELKAERRLEAIQALGAFGANGYGEEVAVILLEIARQYPGQTVWPPPEKEDKLFPAGLILPAIYLQVGKLDKSAMVHFVRGLKNSQDRDFCRVLLTTFPAQRSALTEKATLELLPLILDDDRDTRVAALKVLAEQVDYVEGVKEALDVYLADAGKAKRFLSAVFGMIENWETDKHCEVLINMNPDILLPAALPLFKELKGKRDAEVRAADKLPKDKEAYYLRSAGGEAKKALELYLSEYDSPARRLSVGLANTFGLMGERAKDALPLLEEAERDRCQWLAKAAAEAIRRIKGD